ncbi:MAG: UDP-N-acetylmuramoyl-tripeptide--D-alanyl-D-alanine ligase [bacterium]|nr:UDP-N-acetylmuramoyl-tripeptide--D-alanyl-D-alanine ligase [bacterium]
MKSILQKILRILAKAILAKYKPEVIGVTGSVGKTGAKEAIYAVLAGKFKVRKSVKNYNNEIGAPLTIIGVESSLRSVFGWLKVFIRAIKLLLRNDQDYPKMLILEMAADKPGDLDYLTDIAGCKVGVITSIGDAHIENYKTLEKVRLEKATMIRKLDKTGWAVLNIDDDKILASAKETKAKVFTYAIDKEADIQGKEIRLKFPLDDNGRAEFGLSFKLINHGSFAPVFLPNIISKAGVYAALSAAAVGIIKGLNLVEISQALRKYDSPKGRMKFLFGIKKTFIIDDTYNASPASAILALETLGSIVKKGSENKYAVLGDMLELGALSEAGHQAVGRAIVKNQIDKLIVVGERSRDIARGALAAGMKSDDIFHFAAAAEAGKFIEERIKTGDIILVKGSQGARMEKIVKELMTEPLRAEELLVRQGREWQASDKIL